MPYKSEKIKIVGTKHDKRIKLRDAQKEEVRLLYATGEYSQRDLAYLYDVSRRLIQFTIDPDKLEANRAARELRGGSKQYYVKEYATKATREHRARKHKLYREGLISDED